MKKSAGCYPNLDKENQEKNFLIFLRKVFSEKDFLVFLRKTFSEKTSQKNEKILFQSFSLFKLGSSKSAGTLSGLVHQYYYKES